MAFSYYWTYRGRSTMLAWDIGGLRGPQRHHVARPYRAEAPLHVHRDGDADRHRRGVLHPADADRHLPGHRHPGHLRHLELLGLAAGGDGEAHRHELRA